MEAVDYEKPEAGMPAPAPADFWRVFTDLAEWPYDQGR